MKLKREKATKACYLSSNSDTSKRVLGCADMQACEGVHRVIS